MLLLDFLHALQLSIGLKAALEIFELSGTSCSQ